jgi:hypothetical protein
MGRENKKMTLREFANHYANNPEWLDRWIAVSFLLLFLPFWLIYRYWKIILIAMIALSIAGQIWKMIARA